MTAADSVDFGHLSINAWAAAIVQAGTIRDGRAFVSIDSECWCGQRSRGLVDAVVDDVSGANVPGHLCLECSDDHCRHATLERRCTFALCTREAEVEILIADDATIGQRVCALHVSPVINWGTFDVNECRIRPLPQALDNPTGSAHGAVA